MRIAYTSRYDLENHYGGCIIHDKQTGQDVLIQAGDDIYEFTLGLMTIISDESNSDTKRNEFLAQYFGEKSNDSP